jgi:hypothetical protein
MNGFAEMIEQMLSPGWEVYDPQSGSDCPAESPHGYLVDENGGCPAGRVSPQSGLGAI